MGYLRLDDNVFDRQVTLREAYKILEGFVVQYNSRGEHRVYSHTAWLLPPPEVAEPSQGWYASGETAFPHWKYFLFD